jgi:predicted nucleic acid-binding protein
VRRFVLDASVALAWFLDKPEPAEAVRIKRFLLAGSRAVVPALWHLEIANGLAVAERRGILSAADSNRCLLDIEQLLAQALDTSPNQIPVRQALMTARAFGLSAYDSVYLDLARSEGLPLATLDQKLRAAAKAASVELIGG